MKLLIKHFSPVGSQNPIVAYKAINQPESPQQAISGQKSGNQDKNAELNNKLKEILQNIQPKWDNFEEIDIIKK